MANPAHPRWRDWRKYVGENGENYIDANKGFPIAKWEPVARSWSDRERGYDAERKARGGQTSQEVERAAVWKPAETEDDVIAALERELGESA